MEITAHFRFSKGLSSAKATVPSGILKFLPVTFTYQAAANLYCRYYSLANSVIFDVIGDVPAEGFSFDLLTAEIGFWNVYVLDGELSFQLSRSRLLANRCLIFATEKPQITVDLLPGKQRLFIVGFKRERLPLLLDEYKFFATLLRAENGRISQETILPDIAIDSKLHKAIDRITTIFPSRFLLEDSLGVFLGLLLHVLQDVLLKELTAGLRSKMSLYHQAITYIHQHYLLQIQHVDIAEALHISARTLRRLFEDNYTTVTDYLQTVRLIKAQEMLRQGNVRVKDVAFLLNFPNRRYFSREYKRFFDESPSSTRRSE